MDGSKAETDTDSRVFSAIVYFDIFQAGIYAINLTRRKIIKFLFVLWLLISIYSRDLPQLKYWIIVIIIDDWLEYTMILINYHQLKWSGHQGIRGNEKDNECEVYGSSLFKAVACNDIPISLVVVVNKINDWQLAEITPKCKIPSF